VPPYRPASLSYRLATPTRLACALLVLVCALAAPAARAQIVERESEVTGSRRIMSDDLRDLTVEAYAGYDAAFVASCTVRSDETMEWTLALYGFATAATSMGAAETATLTADGVYVPVESLETTERQYDGGDLLELKRLTLSQDGFRTLAYAETVRITLGEAAFEIDRPAREDMRLILARLGL
jgi:hypothetical protein